MTRKISTGGVESFSGRRGTLTMSKAGYERRALLSLTCIFLILISIRFPENTKASTAKVTGEID